MNQRRRVLIVPLAAGLFALPAAALTVRPTRSVTVTPRAGFASPRGLSVLPTPVQHAPAPVPFSTKLETLRESVAALPEMSRVSLSAAHGSGLGLQARVTGERFLAAASDKGAFDALTAQVKAQSDVVNLIRAEVAKVIVGQKEMIDAILMAAIAGEHVLLEGVPGVAKTYTVNAIAGAINGKFDRIQGTPDMRPSDIVGIELAQTDGKGVMGFSVQPGPIFANLFLVDEINRMPTKTQAGLLQGMQERKVTFATTKQTKALPKTFVLLATQNPIEQEGTNLLPEAQLDRFMFKVIVPDPTVEEDMEIQRRFSTSDQPQTQPVATVSDIEVARALAEKIHASDEILNYIARIRNATNNPGDGLKGQILRGASPRASLGILKAARVRALFQGRAYVIPEDVRAVAPLVLRHRLAVSYDADVEKVIKKILDTVPVGE